MKKLVVFNHKMYLDFFDIKDYISSIKDNIRTDITTVICPSDIFIPFFVGKYDFKLGAQNLCSTFCTGEASALMLKSIGVKYVILGHSERREKLNESYSDINLKIKDALSNNIVPIVCVGETKEDRELKKTGEVILKQLKEYFRGVEVNTDIVIAYEPVWAIGSGVIPSNDDILEVINLIKNAIYRVHNINIRVLYGGSVNEVNVNDLERINELDGYLLGKVSSNPEKVLKLLNSVK